MNHNSAAFVMAKPTPSTDTHGIIAPSASANIFARRLLSRVAVSKLGAVVLVVMLQTLMPSQAQGQQPYSTYRFDSTFIIGGFDINRVWLVDTVQRAGLNRLVFYNAPTQLDDSTVAALMLPSTRDTGTKRLRQIVDRAAELIDSGKPIKVMYAPIITDAIGHLATNMESYAGNDQGQTVQTSYFAVAANGAEDYTFFTRHYVKGWSQLDNTVNGNNALLLSLPILTRRAFVKPDSSFYRLLGLTPRTYDPPPPCLQDLYAMLPSSDSSDYYFLSLVFKSIDDAADTLPSNVPLAIVTLYRRDTVGQTGDTSKRMCNFYTPFSTRSLTKENLSNDNTKIADIDYRRFRTAFKNTWTIGSDTLRASGYDLTELIKPGDVTPAGKTWCRSLYANRRSITDVNDVNYLSPGTDTLEAPVDGSDMYYRIESTGKVKLEILRGGISSHLSEVLNEGGLDSIVKASIDQIYQLPTLEKAHASFGLVDEPSMQHHRSYGILSRMVQKFQAQNDVTRKRQIYSPLYTNYSSIRVFANDFDSTSVKTVQATSPDFYPIWVNPIEDPVSLFYANPSRMSSQADSLYRIHERDGATSRTRLIFGTSKSDYDYFTKATQNRFGTFSMRLSGGPANEAGVVGWVSNLAYAVYIAQFRFQGLTPTPPITPVWPLIQVHADFQPAEWDVAIGNFRYKKKVMIQRPPTKEEIRACSWLAMNCGSNGIMFSQMTNSGGMMGPLNLHGTNPYAAEYGRMELWKSPTTAYFDTMWVANKSRFETIQEVTKELKYIDSAIGWRNLRYAQEQMSVYDVGQAFSSMPLVDTLIAERAVDSIETFTPYGTLVTDRFDSLHKSYVELTHFWPRAGDTAGTRRGSRYILVTNRRLHPQDFTTSYPDSVELLFNKITYDSSVTAQKFRKKGLGNIDVRRTRIRFKNVGQMLDKWIVERIAIGGRKDTIKIDSLVALDWLKPGEGALYRITPYAAGVSLEGTAYNNGVRSENASDRTTKRDRIVVYERDSIVYLRSVDSVLKWGREFRVSDALDSTDASGDSLWWQRPAANFHPVVATVRNDTTCLVVWERIEGNQVSIEGRLIIGLPKASDTSLPASIRARIAPLRPLLPKSTAHAPAVLGLDGGFAVAYPSTGAGGGMSVSLITNRKTGNALATTDSISVHHFKWPSTVPPILVDTTYFPSLGYTTNFGKIQNGDPHWTCVVASGNDTPANVNASIFHLAYQQGKLDTRNAQFIMYNMFGAYFRPGPASPAFWFLPTEHVTAGLPGCGFLHPSLAVDKASVGVAFQANTWSDRRAVLRFRDSIITRSMTNLRWNGAHYAWHAPGEYYEWPSLTHFPAVDSAKLVRSTLGGGPEGSLVWYRTNEPGKTATQYAYRYGWGQPEAVSRGQFPTLTLVSRLDTLYYPASSIFYHGDSSTRSTGPRPEGTLGQYYPARLDNASADPSRFFSGTTSTSARVIYGGSLSLPSVSYTESLCQPIARIVRAALVKSVLPGQVVITPPTNQPGLPRSFFGTPGGNPSIVATLDDIATISRTSEFTASATPVSITRHVARGPDVVTWLAQQPYDSIHGPHDVRVITELVKTAGDIVLWRDDTISVRLMATDTLEEIVEVPSDQAVSGTIVYVRVRMVPTMSLPYTVDGGFTWELDTAFAKLLPRAVRWQRMSQQAVAGANESLRLSVRPNPTSGSTTLQMLAKEAGPVSIRLYDRLGNLIREYPDLYAESGAQYSIDVDLNGVTTGVYLIRAESRTSATSTTLTVVR